MSKASSSKTPYMYDYSQVYGTIFCHANHQYIQLPKYYDIIAKIDTKPKMAYSMILHQQLSSAILNRNPAPRSDIQLYVENKRGAIKNEKDMQTFLCDEGYLKTNSAWLLDIASSKVWYACFKNLLNVGLLKLSGGRVYSMIPIEGKFYPIVNAYTKLLVLFKRDSNIRKSITKELSRIPEKLTLELQDFNKEDLIAEIVNLKTKDLKTHTQSEIFKFLFNDIKEKSHEWIKTPHDERNSLLDKILEKIPQDKNIINNIKEANITQKQVDKEYKEKVSLNTLEIDPENTHAFEVAITPKIKTKKNKTKKNVEQSVQAAKFYGAAIEPIEKNELEEHVVTNESTRDPEKINEVEEKEYDIFGIEIDQTDQTDQFEKSEINSDTNIDFDPNEFWK